MFKIANYSVETVFQVMVESKYRKSVLPDGRTFNRNSPRMVLFQTKGTTCVTCGIQGTVFVLETHDMNFTPHLNLYAINDVNEYVLMTKDHIQPRSKGGKNELANYETMCQPCNTQKSDTFNENGV